MGIIKVMNKNNKKIFAELLKEYVTDLDDAIMDYSSDMSEQEHMKLHPRCKVCSGKITDEVSVQKHNDDWWSIIDRIEASDKVQELFRDKVYAANTILKDLGYDAIRTH